METSGPGVPWGRLPLCSWLHVSSASHLASRDEQTFCDVQRSPPGGGLKKESLGRMQLSEHTHYTALIIIIYTYLYIYIYICASNSRDWPLRERNCVPQGKIYIYMFVILLHYIICIIYCTSCTRRISSNRH